MLTDYYTKDYDEWRLIDCRYWVPVMQQTSHGTHMIGKGARACSTTLILIHCLMWDNMVTIICVYLSEGQKITQISPTDERWRDFGAVANLQNNEGSAVRIILSTPAWRSTTMWAPGWLRPSITTAWTMRCSRSKSQPAGRKWNARTTLKPASFAFSSSKQAFSFLSQIPSSHLHYTVTIACRVCARSHEDSAEPVKVAMGQNLHGSKISKLQWVKFESSAFFASWKFYRGRANIVIEKYHETIWGCVTFVRNDAQASWWFEWELWREVCGVDDMLVMSSWEVCEIWGSG